MKKHLLFVIWWLFTCYQIVAQPFYYNPDVTNFITTYGCNNCHGGTSGFFITTYDGILAGGNDCGNTIVPFNADASPIIWQIDPNVENCPGKPDMPFGGPIVSPEDVAIIREWINTGALESSASACADLVFSAYIEGTSFNKCLEIFNGTGGNISLDGYAIHIYNNGNITLNETINLSGVLEAEGYFLVCHTDFALPGLTPDLLSTQMLYNGNDAIALFNGTNNVDVIGQIGVDPGDSWISNECSTENMTLVKIDNGTDCKYAPFSGTTDFTPILGAFYQCFSEDDPSGLNTYTPVVECPDIDPPLVSDSQFCIGGSLPVIDATVFDENLTVNWFNEQGDLIGTGLSIEIPESGLFSAIAIDLDACESDPAFFTITGIEPPSILSSSVTCSPDGLTYNVVFNCETPGGGEIFFNSVAGFEVFPLGENSFAMNDILSGTTDIIVMTDENGCSSHFEYNYICDLPAECPELTPASPTDMLLCPGTGEILTLKVDILNALPDDVLWSTGETGIGIDVTGLTSDNCDGTFYTYTASIAATADCPEVNVTFTVFVLPDVNLGAALEYNELSCTVSLVGYCEQFFVEYSLNGGENVVGNTYALEIGETAELVFVLYDPTDLCPNEPYTFSGSFTCEEMPVANLGGAIWNDETADGIYDELNEAGVEGVLVTLFNAGTGEMAASTYTNEYGFYYFDFIPPGDYYIEINVLTIPEGFEITGGVNEFGQSATVTLGDGESFSILVPLMEIFVDPCDLQEPIVINTQEINYCSTSTYIVRLMVSGGNMNEDYAVTFNDTVFLALASNVVVELGPFDIGIGYSILVTDATGCIEGLSGFPICTVPVSLVSFTGTIQPDGNMLRWMTATETNNQHFVLQHSTDGIQFLNITQIEGSGNSSTAMSYSYLDKQAPSGLQYYRLIQVNFDGSSQILGIVSLTRINEQFEIISILPVPVNYTLDIKLYAFADGLTLVNLYDITGKNVFTSKTELQAGLNDLIFDVSNLPEGIYLISLQTDNVQQTFKILKQ